MSNFKDKVEDLARQVCNEAFRNLTSSNLDQDSTSATLAKVVSTSGSQYIVILASGETMVVYPGGSRPIGIGGTYHLVGDTIF